MERRSPNLPRLLRWLGTPEVRQVLVLAIDGGISALSFWFAMQLRFEGSISEPYRMILHPLITLLAGCRLLANLFLRLHRWSFHLSGLADGARVGVAGLAGTGLFLGLLYLLRVEGTPRSVVVLELLMSTFFMATLRFSPRLVGIYTSDWTRTRRKSSLRTLIVGAGAAGEMLLRDLQRSGDHNYSVVGFVDDDRSKHGMILGGKQVWGPILELPRIARAHEVQQVLIAVPKLKGRRVREILSLCADLKLRFKILPISYLYFQDRPAAAMMQDLSPEDLLPREPVTFSDASCPVALEGRAAVVTGAAGSIGSEICVQLARAGLRRLAMVDLDENELYLLSRRLGREFPEATISVEVADIRDHRRINALIRTYRPHDVFHAAAHKHVPLMEAAPCEAVKNNILGTRNVVEAAHHWGVERFLYLSSDKAVKPTSIMGASKRVGEYIVRAMAERSKTRFCAVRFGNVLGSAGSVVPVFRDQIAAGSAVTVTHPEVRRYFMTIQEAVALVLQAAYGNYGELCILDMGEQLRIVELARSMITMAGLVPDIDIPIVFTGLRPGEKLFEELLTEDEERTRKVDHKILVAESPRPPEDLGDRLHELAVAAQAEHSHEVIQLLRRLVPSYRPHELILADEAGPSWARAGSRS